jgi:hypothetical protein
VASFEAKHVQAMKELVDRNKIDCDYVVTKAADVQLNPRLSEKLKRGYDQLIASGCSPTMHAKYVEQDNAEAVSPCPG